MRTPLKSTAIAVVPRSDPRPGTGHTAIRLPASIPEESPAPAPTEEEIRREHVNAEFVGKNEKRIEDEAKSAPPPPSPKDIFAAAPMTKNTLVSPVEVDGELMQCFLQALGKIAPTSGAMPVLKNVLMTFAGGKVRLEATDGTVWALGSLKAFGGNEGFQCVVPLARSLNIVKRLRAKFNLVTLGMDENNVHIGPYSLPFGGSVSDFPVRTPLLSAEVRVALPAHYIEEILHRVGAAASGDETRPDLGGVHIDLNDKLAVATDGHRMHILNLPRMQIDARDPLRAPPPVTIPVGVFEYLAAVVTDREWVAVSIHENLVMVVGEEYGILAPPVDRAFPPWRQVDLSYTGFWTVDRQLLATALKDAHPIKKEGGIRLTVDNITDKLLVTALGPDGESFQQAITARRQGGPMSLNMGINPVYLAEAVAAVRGGLVRLGFEQDDNEGPQGNLNALTVQGEDDDFKAVVMPCKL